MEVYQNPKPHQGQKITLLDFPDELTLLWVGMVSSPDDLFALSRVGKWKFHHIATMQLLKTSSRARNSALYWASMKGDVDLLHLAVSLGARIDHQFTIARANTPMTPAYRVAGTALNIAIYHQQVHMVQILLQDYAANCSALDMQVMYNEPCTPLQWALYFERSAKVDEQKQCDIINILIDHDAIAVGILPWRYGVKVDPFTNALMNDCIPASILKRLISLCNKVSPDQGLGLFYYSQYLAEQIYRWAGFTPVGLQKLELLLELVYRQGPSTPNWPTYDLLSDAIDRYVTADDPALRKLEQLLQLVLAKFTQPDTKNGYSKSPFVMVVESLLGRYQAARIPNKAGALNRGKHIFQKLLDAGINAAQHYSSEDDPDTRSPTLILPFDKAGKCHTKHVSTVLTFLCRPEFPDGFHVAEFLKFLIVKKGTPVDTKDQFGLTALHYASKFSVIARVRQLINHGANVNEVDNRGLTPLHFACRYDPPFNVEDVRTPEQTDDHYGHQSLKRRLEICRKLLENGADPSITDREGFTPLHYACKFGFLDLVVLLLGDPRVNANAPAHDLTRPLHLLPYQPPCKLTVYHYDTCDRIYTTDIRYTMVYSKDNCKIASRLLDAGAQANAVDDKGCLPIAYARTHKDTAVVNFLLEHGGGDGLPP